MICIDAHGVLFNKAFGFVKAPPLHPPTPFTKGQLFSKWYNIHTLERFFSIRAEVKFFQLDLTNRDRTMVALNIK